MLWEFPQIEPDQCSWMYSAAGHGKNVADGIGAVIKHTADRLVSHGEDIPDAITLFQKLLPKLNKVKLFYTPAREVENHTECNSGMKLKRIPGTMKVHQVHVVSRGQVSTRHLSCFCNYPSHCECFNPAKHCFMSDPCRVQAQSQPQSVQAQAQPQSIQVQVQAQSIQVNQFCIVMYDDHPYVGQVVDTASQDEFGVSVMHQRGISRFTWPTNPDILVYDIDDVEAIIEEPKKVTRLYALKQFDWEKFTALL